MRQCPMYVFQLNSAHCWKHLNFMHRVEKPEHLQFKYNERGAKCKFCDIQAATPSFNKLLDHEISHMPNSHYLKCKLCDWKTKIHSSMNFHLRVQHAETIDVTTKSLELNNVVNNLEQIQVYVYTTRFERKYLEGMVTPMWHLQAIYND
ncbi:uncharacterized protein [Eurosta solidaginis]|uniref:uncharacterized protein n=1 Tax=Eurosta solidaginis TaxID=178769 RepID=UPI003530E5E6